MSCGASAGACAQRGRASGWRTAASTSRRRRDAAWMRSWPLRDAASGVRHQRAGGGRGGDVVLDAVARRRARAVRASVNQSASSVGRTSSMKSCTAPDSTTFASAAGSRMSFSMMRDVQVQVGDRRRRSAPAADAPTASATGRAASSGNRRSPSAIIIDMPQASQIRRARRRRARAARSAKTSTATRSGSCTSVQRTARRRQPSIDSSSAMVVEGRVGRGARRRLAAVSQRADPALAARDRRRRWRRDRRRAASNGFSSETLTANVSRSFDVSRGASSTRSTLRRRSASGARPTSRPSSEPSTCHGTPGVTFCRAARPTPRAAASRRRCAPNPKSWRRDTSSASSTVPSGSPTSAA